MIIQNPPQVSLIRGQFFDKSELARELGVSERTLDRWHTHREGPPRIKIGRQVWFEKFAVLEWMRAKTECPEPKNGPKRNRTKTNETKNDGTSQVNE